VNFSRATFDEKIEEARRRDERRAKGLPLSETPAEREARIVEDDTRQEKLIQAECRRTYIAYGCMVYNLSQVRASKQSPGLPDMIVFHRRARVGWMHETKTRNGVQSPAQKYFEDCAALAGWQYVIGGVAACEEQLIRIGVAERIEGTLEIRR
jgi:hypothetical protein